MRILVTAGGTRERIDPVRFISNASTGKMGYAIAEAAIAQSYEVTLITAPTSLAKPNCNIIEVESCDDMFKAVRENLEKHDCLIMSAAVSDYTPEVVSDTKIKKTQTEMLIRLKPTTDIINWAGQNKTHQTIVGFALEDTDLIKNAEEKMLRKNMDMIVANSPAAISADSSEVFIKLRDHEWQSFSMQSKKQTAEKVIELISELK